MTRKNCPHCGISSHAEARFCRLCGASLRTIAADEPFASPMDATVPLPRNLHPALNFNQEETGASLSSVSSSPAASVTIQSATPQHTGESTSPPTSQEEDAVDGEMTLFTTTRTPLVAQTSGLTPLRATGPVKPDDLQPILHNREGDAQAGVPLPASVEESAIVRQPHAKSWRWWLVASTCVAVIAAVLTLAVLTSMYSRRTAADAGEENEIAASEGPEAHSESLRLTAEAERLLAAGATEAAITQLREAVRLDDRNARAQLQLGAALERAGKRSEAIVFYQAASALAPNDPQAWQPLAEAQFAENRFAEAAQSYRRFFDLTENASRGGALRANDAIRLRYAEALRLAGESEQSQSVLAQVAVAPAPESSADEEDKEGTNALPVASPVSNAEARNIVAAKPSPLAVPPGSSPTSERNAVEKTAAETRLPPQERFERAVRLYAVDRQAALREFESVAGRIPDAHYYLGLARTEGRPLQSIHRAILLEALKHFQTAQNAGGRYSAQAKRLADQLGREYDRRRKSDER